MLRNLIVVLNHIKWWTILLSIVQGARRIWCQIKYITRIFTDLFWTASVLKVYFSDSLIYTSLDQIRFRRSDMLIQNFQISSECDKLVLLRIFRFLFIFSQNKHQIQLTHYMSAYTSKRYSYTEKKTWMLFCLFCILMIETYVYTYWPIHR